MVCFCSMVSGRRYKLSYFKGIYVHQSSINRIKVESLPKPVWHKNCRCKVRIVNTPAKKHLESIDQYHKLICTRKVEYKRHVLNIIRITFFKIQKGGQESNPPFWFLRKKEC
ncbi:hypothetical protein GWI33_012419 [Rhynchophorus ferrugineus]|uniref:Uncharacterized protein n=1 Tax=Rhynchophorus ferrugineus TaxID=354439 RepID=A0A834IIT9_RHYFE|nr:hypothetical protein GWI33_012419 [Rhynchophorus ferrugineus]